VTGIVEIASALLFGYLLFVAPIRGRTRYQRFRQEVAEDPSARLRYYRSSLPRKYALSFAVVALFFANHRDASGIRLATSAGATAFLLPIIIGVLLGAVLLKWRLRRPLSRVKLARSLRNIADLLPRTVGERRTWVLVSITAGVTEELIYRGFVLCVLDHVLPSADTFTLLVIGGVIFGLVHLYQGVKGILLTGVVGVALGTVMVGAGLFAAMVVHTLIDLRLLVVPPDLARQAVDDEPTAL
jgi:membrane protease YdiL (CAAX protease family)